MPRHTYVDEQGHTSLVAFSVEPIRVDLARHNDGKDWARSLVGRVEQGDKSVRPICLKFAREALGMDRVQVCIENLERKPMKRDLEIMVPSDLREAEDILRKYGAWAQDRWRRQRCGSAEGLYKHPPIRSVDCEVPLEPFIPDWSAMQVQRCLQVVPMQFRRVLFAYYVPQREHPNAVRRKMGMTNRDWHQGRIFGLKKFWMIYCARTCKSSEGAA